MQTSVFSVFLFVSLSLFWCNLLTCVVTLVIIRSVYYHLCGKTLNKKGRRKSPCVCHDKHVLVATKLLSQQKWYLWLLLPMICKQYSDSSVRIIHLVSAASWLITCCFSVRLRDLTTEMLLRSQNRLEESYQVHRRHIMEMDDLRTKKKLPKTGHNSSAQQSQWLWH